MDKFMNLIKRHKAITALIIIISFALPLVVVQILFNYPPTIKFFVAKWSAGELLVYIGTYLTFLGTITLGALALWQNNTLRKSVKKNENAHFVSFVDCLPRFDLGGPTEPFCPCIFFRDDKETTEESCFCLLLKLINLSGHIVSKLSGSITMAGKKIGNSDKYNCENFILKPHEETYIMLVISILKGNPGFNSDDELHSITSEDREFYRALNIEPLAEYSTEEFQYLYEDNVQIKLEFTNVFGLNSEGIIKFHPSYDGDEIELTYTIEKFDLENN